MKENRTSKINDSKLDGIDVYFEKMFGVSVGQAAGNPDVMKHLRRVHGHPQDHSSMQEENFGRGHVFFNRSISADLADQDTMYILSNWS